MEQMAHKRELKRLELEDAKAYALEQLTALVGTSREGGQLAPHRELHALREDLRLPPVVDRCQEHRVDLPCHRPVSSATHVLPEDGRVPERGRRRCRRGCRNVDLA